MSATLSEDEAENISRIQDLGVLCALVMNSEVPERLIWQLAARHPDLRSAATNHAKCPIPILLGQSLVSVPIYQIERVLDAVFRNPSAWAQARSAIAAAKDRQENAQTILAEALAEETGIDFSAFQMAR